jgi:hypothetical protein
MGKDTIWSMVTGILVIVVVFMLVRPGSPAAKAVADVSNALANMIKTATIGPADTPGNAV